jgi:hypothetical protein
MDLEQNPDFHRQNSIALTSTSGDSSLSSDDESSRRFEDQPDVGGRLPNVGGQLSFVEEKKSMFKSKVLDREGKTKSLTSLKVKGYYYFNFVYCHIAAMLFLHTIASWGY